jgi:hypothetical protein
MARGGAHMTRVHYKGKNDDFFVFLDSVEDYKKWLTDSTVPLAQVVNTFKIFCTHKYVVSFITVLSPLLIQNQAWEPGTL